MIFQETVVLALRLGLARLGHVALDGTKPEAHTSKHEAMSSGRTRRRGARLKEEIARLIAVIVDTEQRSFADPDARIMQMKRGEYDYKVTATSGTEAAP